MIVLVCGGRDYADYERLSLALDNLPHRPAIIVQGGARGADTLAGRWAREHNIHCAEVQAMWDAFGKGAGGKRNAAMLDLKPDYCVALPGGTGTEDMVHRCEQAGVPVWRPYE